MSPSGRSALFRAPTVRIIAWIVLASSAAALVVSSYAVNDTLDPSIAPLRDTFAGRAFLVVLFLLLLVAVGLWFTIAVSPALSARIVARRPSCVWSPVSPALVAGCLLIFYVAIVVVPSAFPGVSGDVFYGAMVTQLGLVVVALVLSCFLWRSGGRPSVPVTGHPPTGLVRGLAIGACAFLLLEPVMMVVQTALICFARWGNMTYGEQALVVQLRDYPAGPKLVVLLLTAALVAPVVEEWLFRAFLFGSLRRVARLPIAVGISAAVFTLFHAGDRWQFASLFVLAIFLALLYEKTQSLYACVTLHVLTNVKAVVALLLMRSA